MSTSTGPAEDEGVERGTTDDGVPFARSPDAAFAGLPDYPWGPSYVTFEGLRMHYVDAGPADGPVALLLHGMPTWSYLNRRIIAGLVAAGWRCIAPDHIGFGRSDKVTDDGWYSIARHTRAMAHLIAELNLKDVTLFCQDWGGPIGLAQAAETPERFARLVIMNTWLHTPEYDYAQPLRRWNEGWKPDGLFGANVPDRMSIGWFMMLATRRIERPHFFAVVQGQETPELSAADAEVRRAYDAPFAGLGYAGHAGPRRFPLSLPFDNPAGGAAEAQTRHFRTLLDWKKPIHFIWGGADDVFTTDRGQAWAARYPHATFDLLPDAAHFLQDTHGDRIAKLFLAHAAT